MTWIWIVLSGCLVDGKLDGERANQKATYVHKLRVEDGGEPGCRPFTVYADSDGDGYGDPDAPLDIDNVCEIETGWATNSSDCDDSSALTHPLADELCDGVDNDCDGLADSGEPAFDAQLTAVSSPFSRAMAIGASQGQAVVASADEAVRFGASNQLDTTFGNSGFANLNSHVYRKILHAPTGHITILDELVTSPDLDEIEVRRYSSAGLLDTDYGNSGVASFDGSGPGLVVAAADFLDDGSLLVAAQASACDVTKLTPNGDLDVSFGTAGRWTFEGNCRAMSIDSQQRVLVLAYDPDATSREVIVARLEADGHLDTTFGTAGFQTLDSYYDFGTYSFPRYNMDLISLEDDRTMLGLTTRPGGGLDAMAVVALNPDGSLDEGFGGGGMVVLASTSSVRLAIAERAGDQILILGAGDSDDSVLAALDIDGEQFLPTVEGAEALSFATTAPGFSAADSTGRIWFETMPVSGEYQLQVIDVETACLAL